MQQQAQQNAAANVVAEEAGRRADQLGPGPPAASGAAHAMAERMQPPSPPQQQDGVPDQALSRPAKARRHSLGSSPTKPELLMANGGGGSAAAAHHDAMMTDETAHMSHLSTNGGGAQQPQGSREGTASETSSVAGSDDYWFDRGWFGSQTTLDRAEQRRPVLAKVDRRLFGRILLSLETMPHHLPDTYLTALQQL